MDYENIKFRAWHKDKGRMYNVLELDFPGNIVRLDYYFITTHCGTVQENSFWEPVDEVELMMYTGQQDKYGKDIYEGDIVQTDDGIRVCYSLTSETKYTNTREIIGNIYENPELV